MLRLTLVAIALLSLVACAEQAPVRIGAAASLSEVLPIALGDAEVEVVYGGSGELAAQLRHGAPFDALLLADPAPLARTAQAGLTTPPVATFGNHLVLVGRPAGTDQDAAAALQQAGCLALGAPGVPAGDYARRWLADLDLDPGALRLIELPHVRAVAAAVETGACPLGMVYATDLPGRDLRPIAHWEPPGGVGPVYAWAVVPRSPRADAARAVLEAALARHDVFTQHGFGAVLSIPPRPPQVLDGLPGATGDGEQDVDPQNSP